MNKQGLRAKITAAAIIIAFTAIPVLGCSNNSVDDTANTAAQTATQTAENTAGTIDATVGTAADTATEAVNKVVNAATDTADSLNAKNLPGFAPIAEGFSLTNFTATTSDGQTFTQENFADKDITAINFWATTCPPCVAEMPELAEFQKALPDNLAFITACLDAGYAPDAMTEILTDAGYEGVNIIGYEGDIAKVADAIQSIPTTVFVNNEGVFVGGMVIGGGGDFSARFTEAFNAILADMGKPGI